MKSSENYLLKEKFYGKSHAFKTVHSHLIIKKEVSSQFHIAYNSFSLNIFQYL